MIFIVEDDQEIRTMETYALQSAGFLVESFDVPSKMYKRLENEKPDLFVLDVMLPEEDGFKILNRIRNTQNLSHIPVMMLTARTAEVDKVRGLDSGADDYLTKPFGILEFISRVKALLRRTKGGANESEITLGEIHIDDQSHVVTVDGEIKDLTFKEYELLKLLASHPERVFSRTQIMEKVWGVNAEMETRTVDMHIKTLRKKLGEKGALLQTIRNVGYKAVKEL